MPLGVHEGTPIPDVVMDLPFLKQGEPGQGLAVLALYGAGNDGLCLSGVRRSQDPTTGEDNEGDCEQGAVHGYSFRACWGLSSILAVASREFRYAMRSATGCPSQRSRGSPVSSSRYA